MKTEDLQAQGLSEEQIKFVMAENGKDVQREKDKAAGYKTQLDTAKETLKGFEGVDITDLQNKITQLTADLAAKETEYQQKIADRDFNDLIGRYAAEYKVHDVKALMPFLDAEKLKASKNQDADIKEAFDGLKKEQSFLFNDPTVPRVVGSTSGADKSNDSPSTRANEALRSLFGKN
ncbi:MAG: phage scaffolding protein [Ruminococcus sp.]|nr:phage scaffolding protein [Ruminococcus sp.]MBP3272604.1 phage scaffolding protein [Ruminococcus sp.]